MNEQAHLVLLKQTLNDLDLCEQWLHRSFTICKDIVIEEPFRPEDFDAFENLVSRYGRTVDMIIHKVFRAIDRVEFIDGGTLIDVVNRAHKRGLFDDVNMIRQMKELRNETVHEYSPRELSTIFADIYAATPKLLSLISSIRMYCRKYTPAT